MFDPFKDFDQVGYLRNRFEEKDPEIIRELEHTMFRAGLDEALTYVAKRKTLVYGDFLAVHRLLFFAFYPWAGQDRAATVPNSAVSKGSTMFCHPLDARRAVEQGLRIGQDKAALRQRPGEVMGWFAYGHPFLDGNGRTMLIIHSELCHRAGFCIEWQHTSKDDYLTALSAEISSPGQGHLDCYLRPFIGASRGRGLWGSAIDGIQGLDGRSIQNTVEGEYSDARVQQKYQAFEMNRARAAADPRQCAGRAEWHSE
ncbi:MAG: Fic family protein [Paludibacterium sp.]|uniref:Fic/DOC family protein n=1 Tax=Paludibacterium sp. TaxID=1917523 RepID=UPI0025D11F4F|nr:Fic family protein [Paludibacterium sp.]MBV8046824.1 Fic family protein [Paludibacterium sp.]MBV8646861.1 Fic family protein [Paludibacterium sp.]